MRYTYIVLAIASFVIIDARAQSWRWLPDSPSSGRLDASDSNHLLSFKGDGEYWLSDDGGESWEHRFFPGEKPIGYSYSAKRLNDSALMVYGTRHLHTQVYVPWAKLSHDTGRTFTNQDMGISGYSWATLIDRTTASWYYGQLAPIGGRTVASIYGGSSNLRFDAGSGQFQPFLLSVDSRDSVAMSLNGVYKSYHVWSTTNLGKTWTRLDTFDREPGLIRSQSKGRWFMSRDSTLYRTDDLGRSWTISAALHTRINDFQFSDSLGFVALYGADHILASSDSGATWFAQSIDNQTNVSHIVLTGQGTGYARVNRGVIKLDTRSIRKAAVLSTSRTVDLGKLPPDSIVAVQLVIRNVGDSTLTLGQPTSRSNKVSSLALSRSELDPKSTDSVLLTFTYSLGFAQVDTLVVKVPSNTQTGEEEIRVFSRLREQANVLSREAATSVSIYPNPVRRSLEIDAGLERITNARIFDVLGRCVFEASQDLELLDVRHLKAGSYLLQVQLASGSIATRRFAKVD